MITAASASQSRPTSRSTASVSRGRSSDSRKPPGCAGLITVDNGPGFAGKVIDAWAYHKGINLHFIRPGKPVENADIGRFNGKFRDECLFLTIDEARAIIEIGRVDYNRHRPHSCPRQPDLRGVRQAGPGQTP